jgi:RND family efflux transporter MFP subunit
MLLPCLLVGPPLGAAGQATDHECLIAPYQEVELRSPVEALIRQVLAERGSRVDQGQVLVELESGVERSALEAAQYRSRMQGEIQVAQARLNYARDKSGRLDQLGKDKFVSLEEREAALAELRVAQAELQRVRDNTELAGLESARLAEVLALRTLRAPFAGIVTERLQNPGELAFTGEGARPILKLAQVDPLRVEIVLPVALYGSVQAGMGAQVVPEPPLHGRWAARVKVVDPVLDPASGTFRVRLELPNPQGEIPAGVRCAASFQALGPDPMPVGQLHPGFSN